MSTPETPNKKILVTGATGYIGGRLVSGLLEEGYAVRVMSRDKDRLTGRNWSRQVETVEADVLNPETLPAALDGIHTAYYLIHSMRAGERFIRQDRDAARNFARVACEADVERIIYLGGLGSTDDDLSPHLKSRQEVGQVLRESGLPVTEFRAAVIVGAGSISFEMVRYLTERVPVMICPRWVYTEIQPISISDTLTYLIRALERPESAGEIIEIGGADVLTYADMMLRYARIRRLRRWMLPVPLLTPVLSSYWVHLVTPIDARIARPLIKGLRNRVVVNDTKASEIFPDITPISYDEGVEMALSQLNVSDLETSWSDSLASSLNAQKPYEFKEEKGMMMERRQRLVKASPAEVFRAVSQIGGKNGWYMNPLWQLRGLLDRLVGGPGFQRGRRDPENLRAGDALDFWRVEAIEAPRMLRLRAEMKLPGQGWLAFHVEQQDDGITRLTQTAYFAPHGLPGLLYWYALFIAHKFIFDGMIDSLVAEAYEPGSLYRMQINRRQTRRRVIRISALVALVTILAGLVRSFKRDYD